MPEKKNYLAYSKTGVNRARQLRRQMTAVEKLLWGRLRSNRIGAHFRRQVPFGPYVVDFLCVKAKLFVELDGGQHFQKKEKTEDRKRDAFFGKYGFTVLRFSGHEFLTNLQGVLDKISDHIKKQ
ncbi:MAG TPA: DUF559 domain-containing protein [Verrucomicrobiae bacterium]|nr:DUF559 domain-containing protein [Verrucomicrobiae bacterium]